jgi:ABC-2 type transport system ATP-binding protein
MSRRHRGRVVASGSLDELAQQAREQETLIARIDGLVDAEPFRALPGVNGLTAHREGATTRLRMDTSDAASLSPRVCALATQRGWGLREVRPERQTLEEMFVQITSREDTVSERGPTAGVNPEQLDRLRELLPPRSDKKDN